MAFSDTEFEQGTLICNAGDPIQHLLIIISGSVETTIYGRRFLYGPGDVLGICDLYSGMYSSAYTTASEVKVSLYPYKNLSALEALLRDRAAIAYLMVRSMCHQVFNILQHKIALKSESDRAYESAQELYPQYAELCAAYALTAKKLDGMSEISPFSGTDLIDEWVYTYYLELNGLDPTIQKDVFSNNPGIALGIIRRASEDAFNILNACGEYIKYLTDISGIFLDSKEHDLFSIISDLHISSVNIRDADSAVDSLMMRLTKLLSGMMVIDSAYYKTRLNGYNEQLNMHRSSKPTAAAEAADTPEVTVIKANLVDSINVILDYSGSPVEICSRFIRNVQEFTNLADRCGADEVAYKLRKELTVDFYEIYTGAMVRSLTDTAVPTIIKMFLNFGYVDAALAGPENADYLYSIADSLKGDPANGIYTAGEWLAAIYSGQKEPCRTELDEDYQGYIQDMKASRQIDEKEANRLLSDTESKLRFELRNAFPVTNKITSGTVSTFCPVFSSHNVQLKLGSTLLTAAKLRESVDAIRKVDFSAFYRETMFGAPELGKSKESIHVEVLPNFILMPTVGTRGIMWQEIEGRNRTTPARIFLPLFLQSDHNVVLLRLTSEFRWEMCKRIQGVRWNDLTDPSLTSEFCDYLQFYKSKRELSVETKEDIKNELTRARNNYKTVFSLYYAAWMQNEVNGSLRLNKVARKLMLTYCPFSSSIRERLKNNAQFSEMITRYENKQSQRVKLLSYSIQKFEQVNKPIPTVLQDEQEYAMM